MSCHSSSTAPTFWVTVSWLLPLFPAQRELCLFHSPSGFFLDRELKLLVELRGLCLFCLLPAPGCPCRARGGQAPCLHRVPGTEPSLWRF